MRINAFSRLNVQRHEFDGEIKVLKDTLESYKDAESLVDENMEKEGIMLRMGEAFTPVDEDKAKDVIAKLQDEVQEQLRERVAKLDDVDLEMKKLKGVLYAIFSTNIHLEEDWRSNNRVRVSHTFLCRRKQSNPHGLRRV